jgi:hypothetical protein
MIVFFVICYFIPKPNLPLRQLLGPNNNQQEADADISALTSDITASSLTTPPAAKRRRATHDPASASITPMPVPLAAPVEAAPAMPEQEASAHGPIDEASDGADSEKLDADGYEWESVSEEGDDPCLAIHLSSLLASRFVFVMCRLYASASHLY